MGEPWSARRKCEEGGEEREIGVIPSAYTVHTTSRAESEVVEDHRYDILCKVVSETLRYFPSILTTYFSGGEALYHDDTTGSDHRKQADHTIVADHV